jgi:ABC-type multidrug transport system ATPase subunit
MLLVLGRPGSGCSTFLKALGNQRAGYESIEGDVRYGGTESEKMAKNYRSEGVFLPMERRSIAYSEFQFCITPRMISTMQP